MGSRVTHRRGTTKKGQETRPYPEECQQHQHLEGGAPTLPQHFQRGVALANLDFRLLHQHLEDRDTCSPPVLPKGCGPGQS